MKVLLSILFSHLVIAVSSDNLNGGDRDTGTRRMAADWRKTRWKKGSRPRGDQAVEVKLALSSRQGGITDAENLLKVISDPVSPRFGQHLSLDQVNSLLAPSQTQIRETAKWLASSGVPRSSLRISSDHGHLLFNTTVAKAEKIFGATYFEFKNSDTGTAQLGSEYLHLPASISRHVDVVFPGTDIGMAPTISKPTPYDPERHDSVPLKARQMAIRDQVDCFQYMTPDCYRALYNMPESNASSAHPKSSIGTFQPAWSSWLPDDMDNFFARYQPELVGQRPAMMRINGGYTQTDVQIWPFNLESNLDHQYVMALSRPVGATNIQVGDMYSGGNLNTMLAAFDGSYCRTGLDPNYDPIYPSPLWSHLPGAYNSSGCGTVPDPPKVISVSYVWNEAAFSARYLERQCLEYLKLGLRGVSVIVASGDNGPSFQGNTCIDPDTGNLTTSKPGFFAPSFPASCPWVTAVGGTQLLTTATPNSKIWSPSTPFPPETAFNMATPVLSSSGGGFSRVFPAPFYQALATPAYLVGSPQKAHLANLSRQGFFDPRGRGYPDVSAVAANVIAASNGKLWLVAGTSASAPLFASMVARINEERLRRGKKSTVGFVNPVLYAAAAAASSTWAGWTGRRRRTGGGARGKIIRDVTTGWNGAPGCGVDKAFPAGKGWDAVTGLGTPDYGELLEMFLALP